MLTHGFALNPELSTPNITSISAACSRSYNYIKSRQTWRRTHGMQNCRCMILNWCDSSTLFCSNIEMCALKMKSFSQACIDIKEYKFIAAYNLASHLSVIRHTFKKIIQDILLHRACLY